MSNTSPPAQQPNSSGNFGFNGGTALVATGAILILVIGFRTLEYVITRADDPTLNAAVGAALAAFTASAAAWGIGKIRNGSGGTGSN